MRKYRFFLLIVALCSGMIAASWLAVDIPQAMAADPEPQIRIQQQPGQDTDAIHITASGETSSAFVPLYLSQVITSSGVISGVRFTGMLFDEYGLPLTATLSVVASSGASGDLIAIPGSDQGYVRAVLNIGNLTAFGELSGELTAEKNGLLSRYALAVSRYPVPSLAFQGLAADGVLKLTINSQQLSQTFTVASANRGEAQQVLVSSSPLVGPKGSLVQPVVSLAPADSPSLTVSGYSSFQVVIRATLPYTGTYTGALHLIYHGKRQTTQIEVTRALAPADVSLQGLGHISSESLSFGKGDLPFWFTLQEQAGRLVEFNEPLVVELWRVKTDQSLEQAAFDMLNVPPTVTLKPDESRRVDVRLIGLRGAGQYKGTVRLNVPGSLPLEQTFTMTVKDNLLTATVLISVGVFASYLLRRYAKEKRPRLVRQRTGARLLAEYQRQAQSLTGLEEGERILLAELQGRLEELGDELVLGIDDNTDAKLKALDDKLTIFLRRVEARRRIDALKPESLRKAFLPRLENADLFLRHPALPTAEKTDEVRKDLEKLPGDIHLAIQKALQEAIAGFKGLVDELASGFSTTEKDRLKAQVLAPLEEIKAQVDGASGPTQLEQARIALNQTRHKLALLLAEHLRNRLEQNTVPAGYSFDPTAWAPIKKELLERLKQAIEIGQGNPEEGLRLYQAIYRDYLHTITARLEQEAKRQKEIASLPTSPDPKKSAEMQKVLDKAERILEALGSSRLAEAARMYQEAEKTFLEYAPINKDDFVVGTLSKDWAAAQAIAGLFMGGLPEEFQASEGEFQIVPERTPFKRRSVAWFQALLNRGDFYFALGIGVVAVLSGIMLLWLDNATWGSINDYIIALLWGLGLHQISGQALDLSAMGEKFKQ